MIKTKEIKKEINIGLQLLKIYLSYIVVNSHCLKISNIPNKLIFILVNNLHVPTFFIISFYFFHNSLITRNLNKFYQRFQRLLIPYIIWPFIIYIINNIILIFYKIELAHSFLDLRNQLLTGCSFIPTLWFQWDLIFETFIFIIIELLFHKYIIFILINIGFLAYFLQYSNYNYYLFRYYNYERKYIFGRLLEIIQYSISGFIIAYYKVINKLKKYRTKTMYLCFIIFYLVYKYNIFWIPQGFGYQGLKELVLSICLFIFFSIISNYFLSNYLIAIIKQISKFTAGIYYIHIPLMHYFKYIFLPVRNGTIFGSLFIYIISYLICLIGTKMLIKTKLKNLFQ